MLQSSGSRLSPSLSFWAGGKTAGLAPIDDGCAAGVWITLRGERDAKMSAVMMIVRVGHPRVLGRISKRGARH
jgi:hypothetical protein